MAHAEVGRKLVAKLPRAAKGSRFGKERFALDLANKTVTCPQGVTTTTFEVVRARNAEPGRELLGPHKRARLFVFPPESCGSCPERSACISDKHVARSVEIGPNEALFIEARAYQTTDAYKADRRARQVVERQVARMVRLGARIARVFGMVKVRAQTAFIAAAREPRTIGDAARDGDCRCPLNPPRATAPEPQPRSPPRTRTPPCPEPRAAA